MALCQVYLKKRSTSRTKGNIVQFQDFKSKHQHSWKYEHLEKEVLYTLLADTNIFFQLHKNESPKLSVCVYLSQSVTKYSMATFPVRKNSGLNTNQILYWLNKRKDVPLGKKLKKKKKSNINFILWFWFSCCPVALVTC